MSFKGEIPFLSTHLHITPCTFSFPFLVYSASRASNSDIVEYPRVLRGLRMRIKETRKIGQSSGKGDYDKIECVCVRERGVS
jgi:hypothetical protein